MTIATRIIRSHLLARCDRWTSSLRHRDDGGDGTTGQIREGILLAREVIERTRGAALDVWLADVASALLRAQGGLCEGRGEDDRTAAGVATIRVEVEGARSWLVRLGVKVVLVLAAACGLIWRGLSCA